MKTKAAASPRVLCFLCNSDTTESKPKRQRRRETLSVKVRLEEFICDIDNAKEDSDKHFGLFVWPAALVLSRFIAYEAHWLCRDKIILELGCGTGLPSILAGVCGASRVYLTDRPDAVDIHRNVETNIKLNGLETRATFLPLAWGEMHLPKEMMSIFRTVHVILAADCFYHSEDFEKVLATVARIMRSSASTSCRFFFTYQLRSINRSIAPLLSRWGLTATSIEKSTFPLDGDGEKGQTFDNIYLYEVQAQL